MLFSLHTRLRVHWAPGFPCALLSEARTVFAKPGRIAPRERGVLFWKLGQRHCEERQRRGNPFFLCAARTVDCFAESVHLEARKPRQCRSKRPSLAHGVAA